MTRSPLEALSALPRDELKRLLETIDAEHRALLPWLWALHARPAQLAPAGEWRTWLVMAGRGFGKTRAGAEWVRAVAERDGTARIALVGASLHEARSVMVEGESGLLAIAPPDRRPIWRPALRRLVWPSGAQAAIYGAADPDGLRGAQHSHGWADEIAKWPFGEAAWDNLMLGMRLGRGGRVVATTTPRPVALVRRLLREAERAAARGSRELVVTGGGTEENRAHLSPAFLAAVAGMRGTRLGRQELDGVLIDDVEGALWTRALIERCRATAAPAMVRVVVGVDPPAGSEGDACGIVVVGLGDDGRAYVLEDASVERRRPEGWARAVTAAAGAWGADRVVAEANNGGAMVASVLKAADAGLPLTLVHASRSKAARAEPVATLYEAGKARHAGAFAALEDEMCGLIAGGGYAGPGRSPDRADALVWAMSALMLSARRQAGVRMLG